MDENTESSQNPQREDDSKPSSNALVIGLVVVVVLIVLGFFLYTKRGGYQVPAPAVTEQEAESNSPAPIEENAQEVTVNIEGFEYGFSPKEIRVRQGDRVRVVLANTGKMPHNFVIDELNVATQTITEGGSDTVEFVVDTAGIYEFYCSVGNHRALGMVGNLIVE